MTTIPRTSLSVVDISGGEQITQKLETLASKFDLSYQYGVASHDFTITRAP